MRIIVSTSIVFVLLSASACTPCPLWDQGCGGRVEEPGRDYIKYSGFVTNAVTGVVVTGRDGATVTFEFPNRPETYYVNMNGTFILLANTKRLPRRVSVSAPGYESWTSDLAKSGVEVKITALLKPIAPK